MNNQENADLVMAKHALDLSIGDGWDVVYTDIVQGVIKTEYGVEIPLSDLDITLKEIIPPEKCLHEDSSGDWKFVLIEEI
jgi:hypothetical protein